MAEEDFDRLFREALLRDGLIAGTAYRSDALPPSFALPAGAAVARLFIIAPNAEEFAAVQANEERRTKLRNGQVMVQGPLFAAAMMQDPIWGTCDTRDEGYILEEHWVKAESIIINSNEVVVAHSQLLDLLKSDDENGQTTAAHFVLHGFAGEQVSVAFAPRAGVRAIMQRLAEHYGLQPKQPLANLKGFDWVFVTLHADTNLHHMQWYPL